MKFLIVFVALFALTLAAPVEDEVQVLRSDSKVNENGYDFSLETSDGTKREEQGHLINPGSENEGIAIKGLYSFVGDDGVTYTVNFIADENGFQPSGAHLPHA